MGRKEFIDDKRIREIVRESFKLPKSIKPDTDLKIKFKDLTEYTKFLTDTLRMAMDQQCEKEIEIVSRKILLN